MKLLKQNTLFIGTLDHYPELRYTPTGKAVASFYLIYDDRLILCEAWEQLAEDIIERNLQPQTHIEIRGSMRVRHWDDRNEVPHEVEYILVMSIGL